MNQKNNKKNNIITYEEFTQRLGLVIPIGFTQCQSARYDNRPKTQKGVTRKKRVGLNLDVHINAALEAEFSRHRKTYPHTTMPLVIALSEFGDRVCQHRERYYLDGRPISIPCLIEKANEKRVNRGLVKIIYPGCL